MLTRVKRIWVALLLLLAPLPHAAAQEWAVSTNLISYLHLGTLNAQVAWGPLQHWSFGVEAKYNPFTYHSKKGQFQLRQQSYSLSGRWWPWHVWSGWWVAAKIQYQEYNAGGIIPGRTEEGDRVGAGLTAGYTHMLHPHLNMEFGLGLWAGAQWYTRYSCPKCGYVVGSGVKAFVLPSDVIVSLCYVF